MPCSEHNCTADVHCRGLCKRCYSRQYARMRRENKSLNYSQTNCKFEDCNRPVTFNPRVRKSRSEYCETHRSQLYRGENLRDIRFRSGRTLDENGYVVLVMHGHPNARKRGRIYEHQVVMSEYIGRPLLPNENIHHKNGNRSDNRIENLELWSKSQPAGQRVEDKLIWAREIISLYDRYNPSDLPIQERYFYGSLH